MVAEVVVRAIGQHLMAAQPYLSDIFKAAVLVDCLFSTSRCVYETGVKAIANEFAADGLRLVEVKKNQLYQIPALLDSLAQNPLLSLIHISDGPICQ